jgi:restriction system protein
MPEITRKRIGELQRGVIKILMDHPDGMRARDVLQRLEKEVPPTDFEKENYPKHPNVRRFENLARFATIGPVKAGWMVKTKGRWYVTEEGQQAYKKIKDPQHFAKEATRLYYEWKSSQPEPSPDIDEETSENVTIINKVAEVTSTVEEAEEDAWREIEQYVQAMKPYDFQKLVAALLRAMGYHVSWIAPPGPDKGIDLLAHNDPLGTSTPRIKVQVKRQADKVNVGGLRSFMALLGEQDVGIFVATGGFTNDAESEARTKETRKLTLVDLEHLVELWIQHYEKVAESDKRLLPLKPVYYLAPSE